VHWAGDASSLAFSFAQAGARVIARVFDRARLVIDESDEDMKRGMVKAHHGASLEA
jgi:hypothetical protein